jgi:hypothetical protein
VVLLTIKVAVYNASGHPTTTKTNQLITFPQHNTIKLDIELLLDERA